MKYFLGTICLLGGIAALISAMIAFVKSDWQLCVAWGVAGFALLGDSGFMTDDN